MIQLFPRASACDWCGEPHPAQHLCVARPGLTRRSFLFLSTAAIVVAATMPAALLDEPAGSYVDVLDSPGFDCAQFDAILKEIYGPLIIADLNDRRPLLQFIEDTRPRGRARIIVPARTGRNFSVGLR